MSSYEAPFDPNLDLVLEREIDVPVDLVWAAWTQPDQLKVWFCPKPWFVSDAELDLRPGGKFRTVMNGPNGEVMPNEGCFLEVVPKQRLVFTDTLLPGYRPSAGPFMTAIITMKPTAMGTLYRAVAMHGGEETRKQHEEMGFAQGWGKALDQLVAHCKMMKH